MNTIAFILGVVIGLISCLIWYWLRYNRIALAITSDKKLAKEGLVGPASVEHYHWGILCGFSGYTLSKYCYFDSYPSFWVGLGVMLFLSELAQENPFGKGKDHFKTTNQITVVLLILLFFSWFYGHGIVCSNYGVFLYKLSSILPII